MKITPANYFAQYEKLEPQITSEAIKEAHVIMLQIEEEGGLINLYEDPEIKAAVDVQLQALNDVAEKQKSTTKKPKATSAKKSTPSKPAARKPSATKTDAKPVEENSTEYKVAERYVKFDGKTVTDKQVLNLINFIKESNTAGLMLKKDMKNPKLIQEITNDLIKTYNGMKGIETQFKIPTKRRDEIYELLGKENLIPSVKFLTRFMKLQGKAAKAEEYQKLHNSIAEALNDEVINEDDKYFDKVLETKQELKEFHGDLKDKKAKSGIMKVMPHTLQGLPGISSTQANKRQSKGIKTTAEIAEMKFDTIGFTGRWLELCGDPSPGFSAMVYAPPKNGKSYFCLDFAKYLADAHGDVLYLAIEEGFAATLKKKIVELNAQSNNIYVVESLEDVDNLGNYPFVIFDSVTDAGLSLEDMDQQKERYPFTSFINVHHSTKNGSFKGRQTLAHRPDMIFNFEGLGKVRQQGRYKPLGEMDYSVST